VAALARRIRSPESGQLGQGIRFGIAGGVVALIYLGMTTVLANVVGLHFEVALALGFGTAMAAHFSLQRLFVWAHRNEFALRPRAQIVRYVLFAGAQYGTTAAVTAFVPPALHVSPTVVYLPWAIGLSILAFLVFGRTIFHPRRRSGLDA
jgi:putative flippase GtrA